MDYPSLSIVRRYTYVWLVPLIYWLRIIDESLDYNFVHSLLAICEQFEYSAQIKFDLFSSTPPIQPKPSLGSRFVQIMYKWHESSQPEIKEYRAVLCVSWNCFHFKEIV